MVCRYRSSSRRIELPPIPVNRESRVEPKTKADQEKKMSLGLQGALRQKTPRSGWNTEPRVWSDPIMKREWANSTSISSWTGLKRDVLKWKANIGAPRLLYRETISREGLSTPIPTRSSRRGLRVQFAAGGN